MRSNLKTYALEECLDALIDYRGKTPRKTDCGIPLITAKVVKNGRIETPNEFIAHEDFTAWMTRGFPKMGDVVMTTEAPLGEVGQINQLPVALAQRIVTLRGKQGVLHNDYLLYALQSEPVQAQLLGRSSGTTVVGIKQSELRKVTLDLPPFEMQGAIAGVLKALDGRVALLRQTNSSLESIAQALFKSWFIDFDPVRAKAEGREPEGMDAATAALFPAEFEESALRLMPRGWHVAAIQDVVESVYDGPHATPPEASEGPVFLGIKNLTGTSIDLGEVRHIGEEDWARWTKRVTPRTDDIVFSYEAALGLFALIPPGLRCCLGRRLALVRPKQTAGTPHFWFHQFTGAPFQRLLDKHTVQGATVNRIALKEFPSFTVMDPGEQLRAAFEAVARPLWTRIHANRQQALNLAELRDALLPRLISGKLQLQSSVPEPS